MIKARCSIHEPVTRKFQNTEIVLSTYCGIEFKDTLMWFVAGMTCSTRHCKICQLSQWMRHSTMQ